MNRGDNFVDTVASIKNDCQGNRNNVLAAIILVFG